MSYANASDTYRHSSIAGASPIALVIALYDRLAMDLRQAVDALRSGDIEGRCQAVNHAFLVLGQLEDWLDNKGVDPLAQSLTAFYQLLRARMLEASLKQLPGMLEDQIELVLQVRSAWQERESRSEAMPQRPLPPAASVHSGNGLTRTAQVQ